MSKTKIAFFLDVMEEDFDGVSITMHQVISRIPKDQFEAIFITPQPPKNDIGFPVYVCPAIKIPESGKEYLVAIPRRMKNLKGILNDFDPDILHYSSPTPLGNFATKYARRKGIPVVSIYHTHYPSFVAYYIKFIPNIERHLTPLLKLLYRMYYKTDRIFAPTPSMRKYLLGIGVEDAKLFIWGRGVNLERFNPKHRDEHYFGDIPEHHKKVLFVSRLVREKEPETLVRLYHLLQERRPDITMIIVGDGPTKKELQSAMPTAVFTGKLTGMDLSKAYASADIFVFPSTTETFGNVVLEALASGLPVVAAAGGGPKDIIQHGVTGMLVEPQNEEQFFDEVTRLADDAAYYGQMQKAALAYARSQDWESLCAQLFGEYRRLAGDL